MEPNLKFGHLADEHTIQKTLEALSKNGFIVFIVQNKNEARQKVLELLPKGSEVFTLTSQTLEQTGITKAVNESGDFKSVRNQLYAMNRETQKDEMRKLGAAPEWAVGSVHALTQEGQALVASNTGSQLPAYAYGAEKVIWVVGAQKIVKNADEARQRIREYTFPLEDERALAAYGVHSGISKMMLFNKEIVPGRITIIIVKEKLGF